MNRRASPQTDRSNRRGFLRLTALAAAACGEPRAQAAAEGLIVREVQPKNLEMPFSALRSFITPSEQFYVRNHFPEPNLDPQGWKLSVEGAVERPFEINLEGLLRLPQRTQTVLLECAGNNRALLDPPVKGVQWRLGAVGNARWSGVPLATLLEWARVRPGAVEVILEGADGGQVGDLPGRTAFARSLPLEKARRGGVLLAHEMNGKPLTISHGFPVRGVVPGWYGMASVKWLTRIIVTEQPFHGFFQSIDYAYWRPSPGGRTLTPITQLQLKAQIARPSAGETIRAGSLQRISGAAWTGDGAVEAVEVSTDGGRSWSRARLQREQAQYAWRLWDYDWAVPQAVGSATLIARALDEERRMQPAERDANRRNYMVSHLLPVQVRVR